MRNVRIFFCKKDRMKFASHLDMYRLMTRVIRLSKIPVWYTEGFNQHPYLNFALPLSLGFTSDYEILDIKIENDDFSNESIADALKAVLPSGLQLIEVADRIKKSGEIAFAEFHIIFESTDKAFAEKLSEFLKKESIIVSKKTKKGKEKEIDVAPFIKRADVSLDKNVLLSLVLPAGGENNINPALLLSAYCQLPDYSVCRKMIYDYDMNCFK